ncbi:hypothetical protein LTR62_001682 [Meristemomyces frigidus]|uniref:Cullin family profile domain-containing protein n=1 Tax=Meristemomyces frigidus TaxID=1508187 RepID=A0AAN7YM94_9PEZI|nr:hypothetical protein LTR62_001682 [Meristemomyces frigidus]
MAATAFASIFPPTSFTTPTPETTPTIGVLASPGQAFGGPAVSAAHYYNDAFAFSRAWSAATRYLSLTQPEQRPSRETVQAFELLSKTPAALKELQAWYGNEVASHFRASVDVEVWKQPIPTQNASRVLQQTVQHLSQARSFYLSRPDGVSNEVLGQSAAGIFQQLVVQAIPRDRLQATLAHVFYQSMVTTMSRDCDYERCQSLGRCVCQLSLENMPIGELRMVGLGEAVAERAFALAVHHVLKGAAIERRCFQVDWNGQTSVVAKLRPWISECFAPFVQHVLQALHAGQGSTAGELDAKLLVSIAISTLGRFRVASLFDYVKAWPASEGAFADVQHYLAASQTLDDKSHLCESFARQISTRLLHAGASTTDILSIYINVIYAFRLLDKKGVLLEKVSGPIRTCLRGRDDTVAIIAASFLADVNTDGVVTGVETDKLCAAISAEVTKSTLVTRTQHKMLNFDDMTWVPDPIDAGPDFTATKSEDVLAYVLGLFDQEEFVKEVTTVLAQHLLHTTDQEYAKETRLVELFKSRFDATRLQAAEVMLKDVRDSVTLNRRLNQYTASRRAAPTPRELQAVIPEDGITIQDLCQSLGVIENSPQLHAALRVVATKRNSLYFAKRTRLPPAPPESSASVSSATQSDGDITVQVLSSFFWPQMRANDFDVPYALTRLEDSFTAAFTRLGNQRKLHFRRALARTDVKIELGDRTIEEADVPVWRASVIDAFATHGGEDENEDSGEITAEQLSETLRMDEELVADALNFWVSKRALYQSSPGCYAVLERLDMELATVQQARLVPEGISALQSQSSLFAEQTPVFEIFIKNMLQNGGPKSVGGIMGITGMLKMVLPTFTYGDDEVEFLLGGMEGRREVVRDGELWAVK